MTEEQCLDSFAEARYFFPFPNCTDRHWELFGLLFNEYPLLSQEVKQLELIAEH
jgi:hypothetical protein